ncbi:transposase [Streptomyces adustus]
MGPQAGARIPGEIGDGRSRFTSAGGLTAYASSAPIARASGTRRYVGRRFVKYNRLHHMGRLWAYASLTGAADADSTTVAAGHEGIGTGRLCGTCSPRCSASSITATPLRGP